MTRYLWLGRGWTWPDAQHAVRVTEGQAEVILYKLHKLFTGSLFGGFYIQ
jgi:hypothetical protein